jgi:uncharacterized membrane protein
VTDGTPEHSSGAGRTEDKSAEVIPPDVEAELRARGVDLDSPEQRQTVNNVMHARLEAYSAPWPSPDMLKSYEQVSPGLSERIAEWVFNEQAHRHRQEDEIVRRTETRLDRSQYATLGIAIFGVVVSAGLAVLDKTVVAVVIALSSLGGPAAAMALAKAFGRQRDLPSLSDDDRDRDPR